MKRRDFVKMTGAGSASLVIAPFINLSFMQENVSTLTINPKPLFSLSPWLYMQFMEPLGSTDSSVEAAWDHASDSWRKDVIDVTKKLAPGMMRWGGLFSAYYKWKEAIGPRDKRVPMRNLVWGGIETNQVGTAEFIDFCRQVGADPLMCVNFESEGYASWAKTPKRELRLADAGEAAEWVDYCNNPSNKQRISHGFKEPFQLNTWQLGNETSYNSERFDVKTAAQKTIEFSKAMRNVDPSIKTIGWGDSGWAKQMLDIAGEHIDYVAFHHMFDPGQDTKNSVVYDNQYRKDPAATWDILMNGYKIHEKKILEMREQVSSSGKFLALTECHYSIKGRNRCEVLSSWAAGVSYARMMNLHERNGDLLKIATLADFCGTRWQVNAIMIPVPTGKAFMMPVAKIMSLYRKHSGKEFIEVSSTHNDLDITASRTGNTIYLHVVNTNRTIPARIILKINGMSIESGKSFELSADPEFEILSTERDPLMPKEKLVPVNGPYIFPSASITAVELIVS
jgi:alpha-L-arabinofuranosidase